MPLHLPPTFGQIQIGHFTAAARDPITVTAGATAHTKGAWTQLIADTPYDAYGIWIAIDGIHVSAAATPYLVDIGVSPEVGVDPERVIIPNLNVWGADSTALGLNPRLFWFPVYIRYGYRIMARSQSATANKSCRVMVMLDAVPWYGLWGLGPVVDYGTNLAASSGTSVTPGNGAFGSWVQLGTTSRDHTFWTVSMDYLTNTNVSAFTTLVEVGVGPSGSQRSLGVLRFRSTTAEIIAGGPFPLFLASLPVPAGTPVWARAASGGTAAIGVIVYAA
jgi:hypothetical protein